MQAHMGPFRDKCKSFECVLVVRNFIVAFLVCFVPFASVLLPLILVAFLQANALLHHLIHPYESDFDNYAQLASLYLLLISYLSGILIFFAESHASTIAVAWTWVVLMANIIFIAVLVWSIVRSALQRFRSAVARGVLFPANLSKPEEVDYAALPADDIASIALAGRGLCPSVDHRAVL